MYVDMEQQRKLVLQFSIHIINIMTILQNTARLKIWCLLSWSGGRSYTAHHQRRSNTTRCECIIFLGVLSLSDRGSEKQQQAKLKGFCTLRNKENELFQFGEKFSFVKISSNFRASNDNFYLNIVAKSIKDT